MFFLSVSSSCTAFGGFLIHIVRDFESILGKVKTVKTTYLKVGYLKGIYIYIVLF